MPESRRNSPKSDVLSAKPAPLHAAVYCAATQILDLLHRLNSPWAEQARQLLMLTVRSLQRYTRFFSSAGVKPDRASNDVKSAAIRRRTRQLLSEVQERMTLSGQLEPILQITIPQLVVCGI